MHVHSTRIRCVIGFLTLPILALSAVGCNGSDTTSSSSSSLPSSPSSPSSAAPVDTVVSETEGTETTPRGDESTPQDPCGLLDAEQIAAVLGDAAPAGVVSIDASPPLNLRQCDWSTEGADFSSRSIFLSITTSAGLAAGGAGGDGYTAADLFEDTLSVHAVGVAVDGLGDSAFFTDADMQELHVLQGDTNLTISALTLGSAAEPITGDELLDLMERAVARL